MNFKHKCLKYNKKIFVLVRVSGVGVKWLIDWWSGDKLADDLRELLDVTYCLVRAWIDHQFEVV